MEKACDKKGSKMCLRGESQISTTSVMATESCSGCSKNRKLIYVLFLVNVLVVAVLVVFGILIFGKIEQLKRLGGDGDLEVRTPKTSSLASTRNNETLTSIVAKVPNISREDESPNVRVTTSLPETVSRGIWRILRVHCEKT